MQELPQAVARLFDALDRHGLAATRADEVARRGAAEEVRRQVTQVVDLVGAPSSGRLEGPPPRPIAMAMARALFSAPHLSQTLSVHTTQSETLLFNPDEALADALGLPVWQLEEVRDETDQAVSRVLKQSRALHWLWHRAGNPRVAPDPLFRTLFPGAAHPVTDHFTYRGGRLYAVFPEEVPPPQEALYLRWLPGASRWSCIPDSHFSSRYLDENLVRSLTRAIGATDAEARTLLDDMVCAVPLDDVNAFVRHDRWRSEGWAAITGLGAAQPSAAWLTLPIAPEAIGPEDWLEKTDGALTLRSPRRIFDRHATTRLTTMVHGLYTELCARLLDGRDLDADGQPVLFDLDPYLQRILQPLIDWTSNPRAHAALARSVGVEVDHVAVAMGQVRTTWTEAARTSWGGVPTPTRPWTVQVVLAVHLALTQASLHRTFHREPDPRGAHHRILLQFFAHYMSMAPLVRLWKPVDGRMPRPEDVVGEWFWGTWLRVLDATELS